MKIKKTKILYPIAILFLMRLFIGCDITQYKQIGKTNFYLLPDVNDGVESFLYHGIRPGGWFEPVYTEGSVHDVFWNQDILIIKSTEKKKKQEQEHWCIMNNLKELNYPDLNTKHFDNERDYQKTLDSLGLQEKNMEHTDGSIPWSLHF